MGRVICFCGPKEGAGKTTIVLNLALAWAGLQHRNALIVQLDALGRDDVSESLGVPALTAKEAAAAEGPLPISPWGVGSVVLGGLSPSKARSALKGLALGYDLFVDVEASSPLLPTALAQADTAFWVALPHRSHLQASRKLFARRAQAAITDVVINAADQNGALGRELVLGCFNALGRTRVHFMPWEEAIPALANGGRLPVVEIPRSPWVSALRPLLGRLTEASARG